jgi:hypothetical protein
VKFLHDISAAIYYLAHRAHDELPANLISREAAHAFADIVSEREIRRQLFLGHKKMLSELLN